MDPLIPALILSKSLELSITEYGLTSGRMKEANPFITDRPSRLIINSIAIAATPLLYRELKKHKPRLAKATAIILVLGNSYLIGRNLKIINSAGNNGR